MSSGEERLKRFCRLIQVSGDKNFDKLFTLHDASSAQCPLCAEELETPEGLLLWVHLDVVAETDKPKFHGFGNSFEECKANACKAAMEWLDSQEPDMMLLRNKRLRLRLEELGISLPKSTHMRLLEDGREEALSDLPQELVELFSLLEDEGSSSATKEELSMKFLDYLSVKKNSQEVESIFSKLGLSFCDELNMLMNPYLFAALVNLFLRLDLKVLVSSADERLRLAFCKLIEQVLVFNAENFHGFKLVTARLLRYFIQHRAVPFMSRHRIETLAVQLSVGGANMMKIDQPEHLSQMNEETLLHVVEKNTPSKTYLENLFAEFAKIDDVILELFQVRGSVYGSLVNGFPTCASDIDVVINVPCDGGGDEKNLRELNLLFEAIKTKFKGGEFLQVTKIETARVPILIVKKAMLEINISFNHQVVIHNSELLKAYSSISPRVRELVVLVKHWAKKRDLNDALQGTLSSYGYVLMVIHFLQRKNLLPDLQSDDGPYCVCDKGRCLVWFAAREEHEEYGKKLDKCSLTFLIASFFDYFLYEFDFICDLVTVSQRVVREEVDGELRAIKKDDNSCRLKKRDYFRHVKNDTEQINFSLMRKRTWFSIIDPFELHRCLGTSARGTESLIKEMKRAQELLLAGDTESIFLNFKKFEKGPLPPFPLRNLNKRDLLDSYEAGKGLRMKFDRSDEHSQSTLATLLKGFDFTTAGDNNWWAVVSCLSYLSKLGFPSKQDDLKKNMDHQQKKTGPPPAPPVSKILKMKQFLLGARKEQTPRLNKMVGKQIGTL